MEDSVWFKKIENQIMVQNEKLYKKDFKFYHVDTLLLLAKRVDSFSTDCSKCKYLKPNIEEISENLFEYLKGDIISRKRYEKKLNEINGHIRKVHRIYPKQYNLSLYSFLGVVAGLLLGWVVAFLFDNNFIKQGMILGFAFGLLTGRIIGKIKDNTLKKEGRFLK